VIYSLIAEATETEFKLAVERGKPLSWLKSVSAFANGIGGTLFFGFDDNGKTAGLADIQSDTDFISNKIKERISPYPDFVLSPISENGKELLALTVKRGRSCPYYYSADGVKRAYVRIGNESVPAPDHILNELILKGSNRTFDSFLTDYKKDDFSFTLLEATYFQRTKLRFELSDYISLGLMNSDRMLTFSGSLLVDQHIVFNSRIFCTRWNGLEKGSIFDDAVDDKEFEGNLIFLLNSSSEFIKLHNKVRFAKMAMERVDKPDYAERAVTEILVNALIHRDYIIQGREIHVDIYDDRLEITSPGGMLNGKSIQEQDIENLPSERRNPVLADLFHRLKYMERRGSGLKKIVDETKKLPGFSETFQPKFFSTDSSFTVVLKNVNYQSARENDMAIDFGINFGINFGLNFGLNETQLKILNILAINPEITTQATAEELGMTSRNVEINISHLKKLGLIQRVGSRKKGRWLVKQS
jgi:ATP-dependent DNA helicase RecG